MKPLTLFGCFLCGTQIGAVAQSHQPNIVFIMADDLGYTDLGFSGSDYYSTPNIDRLALQSTWFRQAYAAAANSAPSRACLMSGMYTPRHGIYTVSPSERGDKTLRKLIPIPNTDDLNPQIVTVAEALQHLGYTCAQIGKWHLGDDSDGSGTGPLSQGFDVNIAGGRAGTPYSYFYPYCTPNGEKCHVGLEEGTPGEYLTDRLTDEAVRFIEEHRDGPFFLYLSHHAVHQPLKANKELIQKWERKTPSQRHTNPIYAAMIESLDQSVGKVCHTLDSLGIADNTLLVFVSDNGGALNVTNNFPLRGGKGNPYDGGTKVPLLIRWPGVMKENAVVDVPIHHIDFYPTFLQAAGGEKQAHLDGVSILDLMKKPKKRDLFWFMPAYLEAHGGMKNVPPFRCTPYATLLSGHFKLIRFFEDDHVELYNLKKDEGESHNLAKHRPLKAWCLNRKLSRWIKQTNAPVPTQLNPDYNPKY